MKRPLLPVALCYLGGILLGDIVALPLSCLLFATYALAAVGLCWDRAGRWAMAPLLVVGGMANMAVDQTALSPLDLRRVFGDRTEFVTLRGVLSETPELRLYEMDEKESWRTLAEVEVRAVRIGQNDFRNAVGRVAVSTPELLPANYFGGQRIEVRGLLKQPRGAFVEGLFNYRQHLARLGIHYHMQVVSSNDWELVSPAVSTPPWSDRFRGWARHTLARGLDKEDSSVRLLWAMTLGWRTALTDEVAEPFMRSGTMHIFAISGLHVALISGILVSVLRFGRAPRAWCGLIVIPLLWCYAGATGWQSSAIRATIMMSLIIASWALRRPADLLNSLAAAAFIILLWKPQQLFMAGFQLSFAVVLSLALFVPVLERSQRRLTDPDPFLPQSLQPKWRRWFGTPLHYLSAGIITSLAAWLGSAPLIAHYFHLFTPISLLANVIVVSLSGLALSGALASLMVGGWWPWLAEVFNHSAWLWMELMVGVSQWAAEVPAGSCYVGAPGFSGFVLYYAALLAVLAVLAGWLVRRKTRLWTMGALFLLGAVWTLQWQRDRDHSRLTLLPLGGGEAIYLQSPGSEEWLIDCGNQKAVEFVTRPFLRSRGVDRLSNWLLTHGDLRHIGGAGTVEEAFNPNRVFLSEARFRSAAYRQLADRLENKIEKARLGARCGPWTVLHPGPEDRFPQADDMALVLRGEFRGTSVLLLSDLGVRGQNALVTRCPELRAEIVCSGLPVQTEPVANGLLEAVQPRLLIISDGAYPAVERAGRKLRARLAARSLPVIYTSESGPVVLRFFDSGWEMQLADGRRWTRETIHTLIEPQEETD